MKLEVGQFARLKNGYCDELGIGKISFVANCGVATIDFKNKIDVFAKDIKKVSFNIIDLIEEGDYVNEYKVIKNTLKDGGNIVIVQGDNCFTNEEIKSIVIKEQFKQMSYKVGENNE